MSKALRATGIVLASLGIVVLLFVLYELVGTGFVTKHHQNVLREEFREQLDDPVLAGPVTPDRPQALPAPPDGSAIGRLTIPRIDVDVIAVEGVDLDLLARGPGRYPQSAFFGEEGSVAVAGHRTGWGSPFIDLDRLDRGDEIIVERPEATYKYLVTRSAIVQPDDVWVLKGDPESFSEFRLTLTTCTPKYTSRDRLIVWADLVSVTPRGAEEPTTT